MAGLWKQWEGQVVDGEFPLHRYLGGGESSGVFLTEHAAAPNRKAAIKLVTADPGRAERQLARWRLDAALSHPHLIRIFQCGRWQFDNMPLIYVVMEYAEEDLSLVLPDRALTTPEMREMLMPELNALAFLHREGIVHGRLKPSNILAAADQVKLSSDALCRIGEGTGGAAAHSMYDPPESAKEGATPAGDVWALGVTLVEALTQRLPKWNDTRGEVVLPKLSEPFFEIARHCLQPSPQNRWTIGDIAAYLRQTALPGHEARNDAWKRDQPRKVVLRWRYIVPAAVCGLALLAVSWGSKLFSHGPDGPAVAQAPTPQPKGFDLPPSPEPKPAKAERPKPERSKTKTEPEPAPVVSGPPDPAGVVYRALPDITKKARNSIRGRVRVVARVQVDPAGNVTDATLASTSSKYFGGLALNAARRWKFAPAGGDASREWILRFEILKTDTKVVAARVSP